MTMMLGAHTWLFFKLKLATLCEQDRDVGRGTFAVRKRATGHHSMVNILLGYTDICGDRVTTDNLRFKSNKFNK